MPHGTFQSQAVHPQSLALPSLVVSYGPAHWAPGSICTRGAWLYTLQLETHFRKWEFLHNCIIIATSVLVSQRHNPVIPACGVKGGCEGRKVLPAQYRCDCAKTTPGIFLNRSRYARSRRLRLHEILNMVVSGQFSQGRVCCLVGSTRSICEDDRIEISVRSS